MKKIGVSQSNYIPWRGYFDIIAECDVFVLYDDMQYTRRDWRNRNKIKTPHGLQWLTIPVEVKGRYLQKINETRVADPLWSTSHWMKIQQNYRDAEFFSEISELLGATYLHGSFCLLSDWNRSLIETICTFLKIDTVIVDSRELTLIDGKSERLLDICQQLGGDEYISAPAAKNYLDESVFSHAGVKLSWADYSDYPRYSQLHGDFEPLVSIVDLLFNHGSNATNFMKCKK